MKIIIKPKYLAIIIVKDNIFRWLYLSDLLLRIKKLFTKSKDAKVTMIQIAENKYIITDIQRV